MRLTVLLPVVLFLAGCAGTSHERQAITTKDAPAAIGPYSQAVRAGDFLYLAGQIPIDPATGILVDGGIEAQTRRVMENLKAVLQAAGLSMDDVAQCQIFLTDMAQYTAVNRVYATYFKFAPPARAAIQVSRLPRDAPIEIMMTAVRSKARGK